METDFRKINQLSVVSVIDLCFYQSKTRNATCCNNHDGFLHLRFVFKILILSEAYLEPSRTSMMDFFAKAVSGLLFSQKSSIIDTRLVSKYASAFTWRLIKVFIFLIHFTSSNSSKHAVKNLIIKGVLSSLRQYLEAKILLRTLKNGLNFTSKALFVLKIFKFLS